VDVMKIFKFSYSWITDSKSWKWYALLLVLLIVLMGLVAVAFSTPFGTSALNREQIEKGVEKVNAGLLGVLIVASMVYSLAVAYVSAEIAINALSSKNLPTQPFGFGRFLGYIWLHILGAFYAVFSWYDKRFLVLLGAALALFLLSFAVPSILFLAIIAFILYGIVFVYNAVRLTVAVPVFLSKKLERTSDALDESWRITNKRVIDIIITTVICQLIWGVIMIIPGAIPLVNVLVSPFSNFNGEYIRVGIYGELAASRGEKER